MPLRRTSNSLLLIRRSISRRWRRTTTNCERTWGPCWRERSLSSISPSPNLAWRIGTLNSATLDLDPAIGELCKFSLVFGSISIIGAKGIVRPKLKMLSLWPNFMVLLFWSLFGKDLWEVGYGFGKRGWVSNGKIFIFGWTIVFKWGFLKWVSLAWSPPQ